MAEQGVMRLEGVYLGRSPQPGMWRLYRSRNFTRYLEFRKADTLRSERPSSGGVIAWVKRDARVEESVAAVASGPADFLEGGLLDDLRRADDADTLRRVLGLSLSDCGKDAPSPGPKKSTEGTAPPQSSCPDPQSCSTPGCCKF
jgi:hypothetical protein